MRYRSGNGEVDAKCFSFFFVREEVESRYLRRYQPNSYQPTDVPMVDAFSQWFNSFTHNYYYIMNFRHLVIQVGYEYDTHLYTTITSTNNNINQHQAAAAILQNGSLMGVLLALVLKQQPQPPNIRYIVIR